MGETELELTEHVRSPAALVRLEAEAGGVDERDDSERHAAVGKVDAADTSVVLNLNTEEVFIGDFNLTFSQFVWKEDVLVKNTLHRGSTLADAAPSLDLTSFRLSFADDKVDGLLTDSKNLLVLHVIMLISAV